MGCCFSSTTNGTTKTDQKNQNPPKPHHLPRKPPILQPHETPPPPPGEEEEEEEPVIKEVLVHSETPTLPPKTQTEVSGPEQQQEQETSDLSQLSEIYSIAETISTTASATRGLKEDEATSKANSEVKHNSPAKVTKKRPSNGDPVRVRARRVDPSPDKRARGRGRGLAVGSRSRSPGTGRTGGVGRGAAAGKIPTTVTEKTDTKPVGTATVESQSERKDDGKGDVLDQQQRQQVTESLENPLVSLECFIFL